MSKNKASTKPIFSHNYKCRRYSSDYCWYICPYRSFGCAHKTHKWREK
jgi:hypothetical protein